MKVLIVSLADAHQLEKQLRKHKLRKELRDLASKLDDLKRASG